MIPHHCPTCESRWGGYGTCHCAHCHETFTGLTSFDKHRKSYQCHKPQTVGLELSGRKYPCWAMPGTDDRWEDE